MTQHTISRGGVRLTITIGEDYPRLDYFGQDLGETIPLPTPTELLPASPDKRCPANLFPLYGMGFMGAPALVAHHDDNGVYVLQHTRSTQQENSIDATYTDHQGQIEVKLFWRLLASGALEAKASVKNLSIQPLRLQRLNALTLPLPEWADTLDAGFGAWSSEGHSCDIPILAGEHVKTSRGGRPGFDGGSFLLVKEPGTDECQGKALGACLAYSGNHEVAVESFSDGHAQLRIAEWLAPGEIVLQTDEAYASPTAVAATSSIGFNGVARTFHAVARELAPRSRRHRPVQLNTWEAAYFAVDEQNATRLADEAAAIGAERFVLDDGWFCGRDGAVAGLGDWTPDPVKFPNGLAPLAAHVESLGMEFGLWLEPEMVNEDSDLYRTHPEWTLHAKNPERPTGRCQLVLDLSVVAVRDYLFNAISTLLRAQPIRYLKWDSNRELYPAVSQGKPTSGAQIEGLYELLSRLRDAHPDVSIESCASGGGRIDFGVLAHADRFWTSDSTDPWERIRIQRRAALTMPPEMLGAHVGPSPNHWTSRSSTMALRCMVAFFGHFGVELDPASLDHEDRGTLQRAITAYKTHRPILIDGDYLQFPLQDSGLFGDMIVGPNGDKALLRFLRTTEPEHLRAAPVIAPGLPKDAHWQLSELEFSTDTEATPVGQYTSEALARVGAFLAPRHAGQGRLFLLERAE